MSLDEWLRRLLREKKRPEVRMNIFREWRRKILAANLQREPTEQEVERDIRFYQERKFSPENFIFGFGDSLIEFVPEFHKQNRIKRAQTAANKRWLKKSEKSPSRDF